MPPRRLPLKYHIWRSRRLTFLLVAIDAAALGLLWRLAWSSRAGMTGLFGVPINAWARYAEVLPALLAVWIAVLALWGHYAHRERFSSLNQVSRVFKATLWCFWGTVVLSYFVFRSKELGRSIILFHTLFVFLYLYASRSLLRALKRRALRRGEGARRTIIVGVGALAVRVAEHLADHPEIGFRVVGFVRPSSESAASTHIDGAPVVGDAENLERIIDENEADEVFFAEPAMPENLVLNLTVECEDTGASFKIVSGDFFRVLSGDAILEAVDGIPVTRLGGGRLLPFDAFVKRLLDLAVVAGLAPLWGPAAAVIALAVWLDDGRPVFFRQRRVGMGGREFDFYKFRTMRVDTDPYAHAPTEPDDARVTRVGRFLRKTSLDEIPQFWNVLTGDMSVVGPRPEMPFLVERYEEWQRARLDVKPGITGLWQVVGRKNLPLEFNIEYDLWYIRNRTLLLDLSILVKTVPAVLFGRGAF